ncbi:histone-lysine N-methyltransferase SETMAR [Biomphalaria glabrata]|nr:CAunnamed protein product [Biomphalaria glabrata]
MEAAKEQKEDFDRLSNRIENVEQTAVVEMEVENKSGGEKDVVDVMETGSPQSVAVFKAVNQESADVKIEVKNKSVGDINVVDVTKTGSPQNVAIFKVVNQELTHLKIEVKNKSGDEKVVVDVSETGSPQSVAVFKVSNHESLDAEVDAKNNSGDENDIVDVTETDSPQNVGISEVVNQESADAKIELKNNSGDEKDVVVMDTNSPQNVAISEVVSQESANDTMKESVDTLSSCNNLPDSSVLQNTQLDTTDLKTSDDSTQLLTPNVKRRRGAYSTPESYWDENDLAHLRKPFMHGWKREIVYRNTSGNNGKLQCDVYYFPPKGKKLRSLVEVSSFLNGDKSTSLNLTNFTFRKIKIFKPPEEIERKAGKSYNKTAENTSAETSPKSTPKVKTTVKKIKNTPAIPKIPAKDVLHKHIILKRKNLTNRFVTASNSSVTVRDTLPSTSNSKKDENNSVDVEADEPVSSNGNDLKSSLEKSVSLNLKPSTFKTALSTDSTKCTKKNNTKGNKVSDDYQAVFGQASNLIASIVSQEMKRPAVESDANDQPATKLLKTAALGALSISQILSQPVSVHQKVSMQPKCCSLCVGPSEYSHCAKCDALFHSVCSKTLGQDPSGLTCFKCAQNKTSRAFQASPYTIGMPTPVTQYSVCISTSNAVPQSSPGIWNVLNGAPVKPLNLRRFPASPTIPAVNTMNPRPPPLLFAAPHTQRMVLTPGRGQNLPPPPRLIPAGVVCRPFSRPHLPLNPLLVVDKAKIGPRVNAFNTSTTDSSVSVSISNKSSSAQTEELKTYTVSSDEEDDILVVDEHPNVSSLPVTAPETTPTAMKSSVNHVVPDKEQSQTFSSKNTSVQKSALEPNDMHGPVILNNPEDAVDLSLPVFFEKTTKHGKDPYPIVVKDINDILRLESEEKKQSPRIMITPVKSSDVCENKNYLATDIEVLLKVKEDEADMSTSSEPTQKECSNSKKIKIPSHLARTFNLDRAVRLKINNQFHCVPPSHIKASSEESLELTIPPDTYSDSGCDTSLTLTVVPCQSSHAIPAPHITWCKDYLQSLYINQFPLSVLMTIFRFLPFYDCLRLSQVCKKWRQLASHPCLWQNIKLSGVTIKNWEQASIFFNKVHVKKLCLRDLTSIENNSWECIVKALPKIQSLEYLFFFKVPAFVIESLTQSMAQLVNCSAGAIIGDCEPFSMTGLMPNDDIMRRIDNMTKAVDEVRNKNVTIEHAAQMYKVPVKELMHLIASDKSIKLTTEDENAILLSCMRLSQMGFPIELSTVVNKCHELFFDKYHLEDLTPLNVHRCSELFTQNLPMLKSQPNKGSDVKSKVEEHFDAYNRLLQNCIKKNVTQNYTQKNVTFTQVFVLDMKVFTISIGGTVVPMTGLSLMSVNSKYGLFPLMLISPNLVILKHSDIIMAQWKNGMATSQLVSAYITQMILKVKERPNIILCQANPNLFSEKLLSFCMSNSVYFRYVPQDISGYVFPGCFGGPLFYIKNHLDQTPTLSLERFMEFLINYLHQKSSIFKDIKKAYLFTGLNPYNPKAPFQCKVDVESELARLKKSNLSVKPAQSCSKADKITGGDCSVDMATNTASLGKRHQAISTSNEDSAVCVSTSRSSSLLNSSRALFTSLLNSKTSSSDKDKVLTKTSHPDQCQKHSVMGLSGTPLINGDNTKANITTEAGSEAKSSDSIRNSARRYQSPTKIGKASEYKTKKNSSDITKNANYDCNGGDLSHEILAAGKKTIELKPAINDGKRVANSITNNSMLNEIRKRKLSKAKRLVKFACRKLCQKTILKTLDLASSTNSVNICKSSTLEPLVKGSLEVPDKNESEVMKRVSDVIDAVIAQSRADFDRLHQSQSDINSLKEKNALKRSKENHKKISGDTETTILDKARDTNELSAEEDESSEDSSDTDDTESDSDTSSSSVSDTTSSDVQSPSNVESHEESSNDSINTNIFIDDANKKVITEMIPNDFSVVKTNSDFSQPFGPLLDHDYFKRDVEQMSDKDDKSLTTNNNEKSLTTDSNTTVDGPTEHVPKKLVISISKKGLQNISQESTDQNNVNNSESTSDSASKRSTDHSTASDSSTDQSSSSDSSSDSSAEQNSADGIIADQPSANNSSAEQSSSSSTDQSSDSESSASISDASSVGSIKFVTISESKKELRARPKRMRAKKKNDSSYVSSYSSSSESDSEEEEEEEESSEEEEEESKCQICMKANPPHFKEEVINWVDCDGNCGRWFHVVCITRTQDAADADPEHYICTDCLSL